MAKDSSTTRRNDAQFHLVSICLSQSALTAFLTTSHSAWILAVRQQARLISVRSHRDHIRQDLLPRASTVIGPSRLRPIRARRTSRPQVAMATVKLLQMHFDNSHISPKIIWPERLRKEELCRSGQATSGRCPCRHTQETMTTRRL
jgi:hypothetical protein